MKNLTILISFFFSLNLTAQKWINDSNCDEQSYEILNEAITHLANIEQLTALGMAKAAKISDSGCECANLVIAAISSSDANWGSRKEKLEAINIQLLSPEEKSWYDLLIETTRGEDNSWDDTYSSAIEKFPNSPLINWVGVRGFNWEGYMEFSKKFPENASSAYNMIAYGYAYGEYGDSPDYEAAYEAIKKSRELHDGPNALDSSSEIAAMEGNYQKALSNQLKAVDYAFFASPYQSKLPTYWRNLNKETLMKNLEQAQKDVQEAILERNIEEFKKYVTDDMQLVSGDSNLQDFYEFTDASFSRQSNINWKSFDLRDFDFSFSPDMSMVILTFYADGSYTRDGSDESIAYSTRASSVWIATDNGWKTVHTNWAPYGGGSGIPKI
jgi:tetratricopeptide (TPR) repeat protein